MSYKIDYGKVYQTEDTERVAVMDVLEYVGAANFKKLVIAIRVCCERGPVGGMSTKQVLYVIIDLFGIKGYPAMAMINRYTNA